MRTLITPPKLSAQIGLQRHAEKRTNSAYISAALDHPNAKVLALFDLKVPIVPTEDRSAAHLRWLSRRDVETIAKPTDFAFLGEEETGAPVFACNFSPLQLVHAQAAMEEMKPLVDLRSLGVQGVLEETELLLASQVRALMAWHAVNRCCARCGGLVRSGDAGWRRHCGACGLDNHPRMDPVVIMIVTHNGRCLLGRELRFPDELYSTLAGYIEPGDDIEHAVRREIKEEAGIDVGAVHYIASQPWPFPHSLMIGCWGEALTEEITINKAELVDVRWTGREEAALMLAGNHPEGLVVPPGISMAHSLIQSFVDGVIG